MKTPYTYLEMMKTLHDISGAFGRGEEQAALILAQKVLSYCCRHKLHIEEATGEPLPLANVEK